MTSPSRHRTSALYFVSAFALAASCTVDKSAFTFDDDEFCKQAGSGCEGDGDGGGDGDMGGDAGDGDGDTGDGDLGGSSGDGDGDIGMGGSGGTPTGPDPGDLDCDEDQIVVYAGNDIWVNVGDPCPFLCSGGTCTGNCEPGDTQCIGSVDAQYCDGSGTWIDVPTCMYACDPEVGSCSGECTPGDRKCEGNQKQVCDESGTWIDDGPECPSQGGTPSCDDSGGENTAVCTGGCIDDTTQCIDQKQRQTCVGGVWVTDASPCPNVCFGGTCSGQCNPYQMPILTRCNPANGNQVQACTAPQGTWGTPFNCDFTCVASEGKCGGNCIPGATTCFMDRVARCSMDGAWEITNDCVEAGLGCYYHNQSGGQTPVCGECNPGTATDPVSRCHVVEDRPSVEECIYNPNNNRTQWSFKEECTFCYEGTCYGSYNSVCNASQNTASGCEKFSREWNCGITGGRDCQTGQICEFRACGDGNAAEL